MQFVELIQEVKKVKAVELRSDEEDFFEVVLAQSDLVKLDGAFQECFGTPAWPSSVPLPPQIADAIADFGGIMPGQTLYYRRDESGTIVAMLWPWSDKVRTTLKIIKQ